MIYLQFTTQNYDVISFAICTIILKPTYAKLKITHSIKKQF